jgi:hypothetical protein
MWIDLIQTRKAAVRRAVEAITLDGSGSKELSEAGRRIARIAARPVELAETAAHEGNSRDLNEAVRAFLVLAGEINN